MGAACGAIIGATAYTVWSQSTVNEKVYTVSIAVVAATSWLALRWYDRREEPAGLRALLLAVYLMVLGSTNHLMSVLPAPALGLFILLAGPAVLLRSRFWVRAIPLVVVGLSFSIFLPIRAAQDPAINEGDPVCESATGTLVAIYSNGNSGCAPLADALSRVQYAKPPLADRQAPFRDQLLNYVQYFDWQWARGADMSELPNGARLPWTMLFVALGFMGFLVLWRADRLIFSYIAALTGTLSLGLILYLNFKYGFSLAPHIADRAAHEVRERDYFFVASFILWGNIAGLGLAGFWSALSDRLGGGMVYRKAAPLLLVTLIPLASNWEWASRAGDYAARDWAYDLLMSVEPYGVLFTNGDNDTFPLWYLQEIEGVRGDVTVIVVQYLYTDWYPRQLRDRTGPETQRPFEERFAVDLYTPSPVPDSAISRASDEILNAVGSGRIPEDLRVPLGDVAVSYPSGMFLGRGHRLALSFIHDSIGQRPIYFASSAGLLRELGLQDWGVRHGIATKLMMRDLEADSSPDVVQGSPEMGGEWFDVERSMSLVRDIYQYRGIRDREIWQDRSTLNIALQYQFLFAQLADAAAITGLPPEEVNMLAEDATSMRITALGGRKYVEGL